MATALVNPTIHRSATLRFVPTQAISTEHEALCVDYVRRGQDYWFGNGERALTGSQVYKAKEICKLCPLRVECRELGSSISPAPYGVWGGRRFR